MEIRQVRADFKKLDTLRDKTRNALADDKKYAVDGQLKAAEQRAKTKSANGKDVTRKLSSEQVLQMKLQSISARNPVQTLLGAPSLPDISKLYMKNMPR